MKIAIPYESGMVFQHFGHTAEFKFYEVENGQVTASEVVSTNGQGHGALVGFLAQHNANVVFCGGIGPGAQNALAQAGIRLFGGISGPADAAVADYLAGSSALTPTPIATTTTTARATIAVSIIAAGTPAASNP